MSTYLRTGISNLQFPDKDKTGLRQGKSCSTTTMEVISIEFLLTQKILKISPNEVNYFPCRC